MISLQCSVTCGDGIRRRIVICKYTNGSISRNCDQSKRPVNFMTCSMKSCPTEVSQPLNETTNFPRISVPNDVVSNNEKKFVPQASIASVTYSSKTRLIDDLALAQHENDVDSNRITFRSGYTWDIEGFEEVSEF